MKRWDELTDREQHNLSTGMVAIAKLKTQIKNLESDIHGLYTIKDWDDKTHELQQKLYRQKADADKDLEYATWNEIKSCNGCIHLELASLKRINNKNGAAADVCLRNIEIFANQITELTN